MTVLRFIILSFVRAVALKKSRGRKMKMPFCQSRENMTYEGFLIERRRLMAAKT